VHLSATQGESALPESTGPTGKRSARKRACSVWSGGKAAKPYLSLPYQALVIKKPSQEEPHQESDYHKEDNNRARNVAHERLTKQGGIPSQSQGEHDGEVLRSWELPQRFAVGGGGRTDTEHPLGR
jgi:hypothetical protein